MNHRRGSMGGDYGGDMEEKHIAWKSAAACRLRAEKKLLRSVAGIILCISTVFQPAADMTADAAVQPVKSEIKMETKSETNTNINTAPADKAAAVTFHELNDDTVFLKQSQAHVCTLTSSAMMIRRAAMLSGNSGWKQITEQSVRKYAWTEGIGLKWNFTVSGISVAHKSLSSKSELIKMLDRHPEGVVIYNTGKPHAILVTDYTDGILYCSDPSNDRPSGRYPIEKASITAESARRCWYVKKPLNLTVAMDDLSGSKAVPDSEQNAGQNTEQNPQQNTGQPEQNPGQNSGQNAGQDSGQDSGQNAEQNTEQNLDENAEYKQNNLIYTIVDKKAKTVQCTGQVKENTKVTVPATVKILGDEYSVVEIAQQAFASCKKLKELTIGANITSIGQKAFYRCGKLKKVTIYAANLKVIGADAFAKIYKKAQVLVIADQTETSAKLLTGTALPETASVGFQQAMAGT